VASKLIVIGVPEVNPPAIVVTVMVCIGLPLPSTPGVPTLEVIPLETVGTVAAEKVQVSLISGSLAQKSTASDPATDVVAGVNVREYSAWALAAEVLIVILLTVSCALIPLAIGVSDGSNCANKVAIKAAKNKPGNSRCNASRNDSILRITFFSHSLPSQGSLVRLE